ncbi:MAG TPA: FliM/FliN family flagellar motor switch protein [Polyangiaceae bacterium]|nr:FliM/FliN family flagellar motor switch protein [Polyangiaceae bacterium]
MTADATLEAYPWDALPRWPRDLTRTASGIRGVLGERPTVAAIEDALGALLASDVAIDVRYVAPVEDASAESPRHEPVAVFETEDGAGTLALSAEGALVTAALAHLLGRGETGIDPGGRLDPSLAGAFTALVVEAARRAEPGLSLRVVARGASAPGVRLDVAVRLDDRPYAASLVVAATREPGRVAPRIRLDAIPDLPVTLRIVAAASLGARAEIAALAPSDVWLPGDGWLERPALREDGTGVGLGRVALAPLPGDRGVLAVVSDAGTIVVGGETVVLTAPAAAHPGSASMADGPTNLADVALDAPVVVSVEVASVTLRAREIAALGAGDVLETGVRLSEPVVLRVAGAEIASGELVNVDGEIGVKILRILGR